MARIPNLNDRNLIHRERTDGDVLRVENDKGETMLFTPQEARSVLKEYIYNELGLESRRVVNAHTQELTNLVKTEMQELKNDMDILLHREINKMVEKIIHSVMQYNIEAEVDRRVKERLQHIFKDIDINK